MSIVRVLGPFVDGVIEPLPGSTPPPPTGPGRQQIIFDTPATAPGGNVFLKLVPPSDPSDIAPINVYAFFVLSTFLPPDPNTVTPDWLFSLAPPNNSAHVATADPTTGKFTIVVPGVQPSLVPYRCQTVIEYNS